MLSLVAFIIILGVLVTGHELGHFVVAKLAGVKVEVFSIGFGQAVIKKKLGETEYRIAWLPFGGYVKMLGQGDPEEEEAKAEDLSRSLSHQPPWIRIAIAMAGPLMNILMPIAICVGVYQCSSQYDQVLSNRVGAVDQGLSAFKSGIREGDRIVAIDGKPVHAFWEVSKTIGAYDPDEGPLRFQVERQGQSEPLSFEVTPDAIDETDHFLNLATSHYRIGYQPYYQASDVVLAVPEGLLGQAGLQDFDRILSVSGRPTPHYFELLQVLKQSTGTIALEIERVLPTNEKWPFFHKKITQTLQVEIPQGTDVSVELGYAGVCLVSVQPDIELQVGDCILGIDGAEHSLVAFLQNELQNKVGEERMLTVRRKGQVMQVKASMQELTWTHPLAGETTKWYQPFTFFSAADGMTSIEQATNQNRFGFAWHHALERVESDINNTVQSLLGMLRGDVSPTQLSGPVTIFYLAGEFAQAGFEQFLRLLVLLSLSIAVMNLLPLPGLDGGHMLVALIEWIMRRPLPEKIRLGLQVAGVLCIVVLMLFALGNDFVRMWRIGHPG